MDSVPALMSLYSGLGENQNLLIMVTSTFGKGQPPNGATKFLGELSGIEPVKNWDFTVLALGNSAYVNSFVNFALQASDALKQKGCTPVTKIHIADELKNQDEAFCEWETKLYGSDAAVLYQKTSAEDENYNSRSSSVNESGRKMKMRFEGTAPLTKDRKTIAAELNQMIEKNYDNSWSSHACTLTRSTDLFSFKAAGNKAHEFLWSGEVQAGDHIALFPENPVDAVESILRLSNFDDLSKTDEYREKLTKDVDLGRPLMVSSIHALLDMCTNERAQKVLSLIIDKAEEGADDPNSTSNNNPTAAMIVNLLPAGTIPIKWVLEQAPEMMPRFFSISSINGDEVTITQAAFHFSHCNKAGTTSKWLRLGLKPGDKLEVIFSKTDFHLPEDESAPVVMIAAGSGIAPFRSFWMAKKKNPMHLFFGCQRESEVPFKSELEQLKTNHRMYLYPAYSRGEKAQYVQDKLLEEGETIRKLLEKHSGTTVYVCGTPEMEYAIKEKLIKIIGGNIVGATMSLARMKIQGKYIAEVYGKPAKHADSPMGALWEDCMSKVIHVSSSLDRVGVKKPRRERAVRRRRDSSILSAGRLSGAVVPSGERMRMTVRPVMTTAKSAWAMQMMAVADDYDSDSD